VKRIERQLRAIDRLQQRHSLLGFPFAVVKKYGDDQAGKHAALLAHYGFLSLFPLLLVFVTLLGYALANDPELQQRVIQTLIEQFPVLGTQIKGSIKTIQGSGLALVVGILGTLWGGLGITQVIQDAMNDVWNIPRTDRPNFWLRLARGMGALLLVATEVFTATALVYGVFAVVIVLLSWLYLSSQMLLYAAELNVVLARRLWPRSLLQPPLTEPDRRVLTA
jgi:uncharacterized BrkB/YihY/UPF0761 family membrane protein